MGIYDYTIQAGNSQERLILMEICLSSSTNSIELKRKVALAFDKASEIHNFRLRVIASKQRNPSQDLRKISLY